MKNTIIFLGDSLTEWGNWNTLFPDENILNFGIAGDTTSDVLIRLHEVCRHQASKLFLMIGINDLGDNMAVEDILQNYREIVRKIIKNCPAVNICLLSVLPAVYPKFGGSGINHANVQDLNDGILEIARENKLTFINLAAAFSDNDGNLDRRFTIDGIHLSREGYEKWKEEIYIYIKQ